jgi:hypothetical protein
MNNSLSQKNSNTNASTSSAQEASICFCLKDGTAQKSPSLDLQLTDLTASFRP